jgi:hypothetical protein
LQKYLAEDKHYILLYFAEDSSLLRKIKNASNLIWWIGRLSKTLKSADEKDVQIVYFAIFYFVFRHLRAYQCRTTIQINIHKLYSTFISTDGIKFKTENP